MYHQNKGGKKRKLHRKAIVFSMIAQMKHEPQPPVFAFTLEKWQEELAHVGGSPLQGFVVSVQQERTKIAVLFPL